MNTVGPKPWAPLRLCAKSPACELMGVGGVLWVNIHWAHQPLKGARDRLTTPDSGNSGVCDVCV